MKVSELIDCLKELPQDYEVIMHARLVDKSEHKSITLYDAPVKEIIRYAAAYSVRLQ